ncbi:MAG: hypothetical protein NTY53_06875 [Kiritimatiellaeota bacterium]|nr:hypothetical protein [Kiritimatiellota bacterium]
MMYGIVIVLSLVSSFMGFASEVTTGNIVHIKNGRKPNAGAAIFPVIPIAQILALLVAWGLNRIHPSLGFYTVSVLFVVFCVFWIPSFRKLKKELEELERRLKSKPAAGDYRLKDKTKSQR